MNIFSKIRRNEKAIAAVEFALILPVLTVILYGAIEVTRYIYYSQKVESTSAQISNLINQNYSLSDGAIDSVFNAAEILMEPFDNTDLTVIVTSFTKKTEPLIDPKITVDWQKIKGKGDSVRSLFAPNGDCEGDTTRPACQVIIPPESLGIPAMSFRLRDQIVVVEVFSGYESLFMGDTYKDIIDPDAEFYTYTIARPRYGSFLQ